MQKSIFLFVGLGWLCLVMALPVSLQAREPGKPLQVVCTILPVYILTLNVVGHIPGVEVKLLLPPSQGCPHNYDLTPSDLIKIARADLIVANGFELDGFIEKNIKRANIKTRIIMAAERVEPIPNRPISKPVTPKGHQNGMAHRHDNLFNGHVWVSPKAAAVMVGVVAEGLALEDPLHAQGYHSQATQYAKKLKALAQEMADWVSRANNKKCLAFHDSLAYLARDIGLLLVGIIESHPGADPSPKDMTRLIKILKEERVAAIFSEPQYSDKVVKVLSKESGVPFFELDTVATGNPAADTYEKAMRKNLETLRRAIK